MNQSEERQYLIWRRLEEQPGCRNMAIPRGKTNTDRRPDRPMNACAVSGSRNPLKDVKSTAFYYKAVLWAVEQGITSGTSATTFSPNKPCTRGQVVTFLWRMEGSQKPANPDNPFEDVKTGAFYYKAVLWAIEKKITTGVSATLFAPNKDCTRAQCVTFLYREFAQ